MVRFKSVHRLDAARVCFYPPWSFCRFAVLIDRRRTWKRVIVVFKGECEVQSHVTMGNLPAGKPQKLNVAISLARTHSGKLEEGYIKSWHHLPNLSSSGHVFLCDEKLCYNVISVSSSTQTFEWDWSHLKRVLNRGRWAKLETHADSLSAIHLERQQVCSLRKRNHK